MSGLRGVMKDGWHPKGRDGKKESWRNDFKGINQVAGWMGKGRDNDSEREEHVSRPLSSLKDPASFGPPPKHIKFHGPAALPNETTPDRTGLGAPLSREQINQQNAHLQQQQKNEEEEERAAQEAAAQKAAAPPVPYRANRTGLDTSHLPPPPVRRMASPAGPGNFASSKPKPTVPPRVPPRANSASPAQPPSPPPAYSPHQTPDQSSSGYLNQDATSRLSAAGVSVPALGIGNTGTPSPPPAPLPGQAQAPVNELQNRFAQMRTNSTSQSSPVASPPVREGTYNSTRGSPMSASNIESARSAISNFRAQHSDQIEAGKQRLSGFNQKYGVTDRVNGALARRSSHTSQPPPIPSHPTLGPSPSTSTEAAALAKRKAPPPPPPPKKVEMRSMPINNNTPSPSPPPLPLSTKPR